MTDRSLLAGRPRTGAIITVFALLASATPSAAQIPLGAEFRVDTRGAPAVPFFPSPRAAVMTPDGGFFIVWDAGLSGALDIIARRFDAGGIGQGPDFLVNASTTGAQYHPAVGIDDSGRSVVVWAWFTPGGEQVFGQRLDSLGNRLGAEFQVSTAIRALNPSIAVAPAGDFVVVWQRNQGPSSADIFGRRFDASGSPVGTEFQVNSATGRHRYPDIDVDDSGNHVVVWHATGFPDDKALARLVTGGVPRGAEFQVSSTVNGHQETPRVARARDGSFVVAWWGPQGANDVFARRFDASGIPLGADFAVDDPLRPGRRLDVEMDADGDFVITWTADDGNDLGIFGRRFEASGAAGTEFQINSYEAGEQAWPGIAGDPAGNFVAAWLSLGQGGVDGIFAQRYAAGLSAAALAVDPSSGPSSDGNGVFEAGETVAVAPSWLNANFGAETFTGAASSFAGPGTPGDPTYTIVDGAASYGTVASGVTASCTVATDCYALGVTVPSFRPAQHWDASFREEISPANLGAAKTWTLHVGDSFTDVPRASGFYRFVETVLHRSITTGCGATQYCPLGGTTREQMAVFVLVAKDGPGNAPPACATPMFNDVPASSPFCPWIEELARRGVVSGCGGGNYCPADPVSREQMAVFVLATLEPGVTPPACGVPLFGDVPASSPFCRWIEELARRGVVAGCGGGNYCPAAAVTREQMAVFISVAFGLRLYGP